MPSTWPIFNKHLKTKLVSLHTMIHLNPLFYFLSSAESKILRSLLTHFVKLKSAVLIKLGRSHSYLIDSFLEGRDFKLSSRKRFFRAVEKTSGENSCWWSSAFPRMARLTQHGNETAPKRGTVIRYSSEPLSRSQAGGTGKTEIGRAHV